MSSMSHEASSKSLLVQSLIALGVVFGDIGTSPLYAFRECFSTHYGLALTEGNVFGILSLILWTLIIVVCLKYITYVLRADNNGEGGVLSLMALVTKVEENRGWVILMGLTGAALLFGDGVITPAISVLSAVEGLKIVAPELSHYVIPITLVLIFFLFYFQKFGTAKIGSFFGPIILLWFLSIGSLGVLKIIEHPFILTAINPIYALNFFLDNSMTGLLVLGSIFLVVTGGEALYADMGHFGRKPIVRAWFVVAFPALVLNYFGQGALVLESPEAISNPFYLLAPEWALWPLVILAAATTTIASQALISGIYSLSKQAMQLGFFPRLNIVHTSSSSIGQIYLPFVNACLFLGVVLLVLEFKTSAELASAYGVAVSATMAITTVLAFDVAIKIWKWPLWKAISIFGSFLILDLLFFGTNIIKFFSGGWVALLMAAMVYILMKTWQLGRIQLLHILKSRSISVEDFLLQIGRDKPQTVPGYAIFMSGDAWGVPVALLHNLKHNKVLHKNIMILTVKTRREPFVSSAERVKVRDLGHNLHRVKAYFGFRERPNIDVILAAAREAGLDFPLEQCTFVLGRETIVVDDHSFFKSWRPRLFSFMSRNAERPMSFFNIPPNNVIEVGVQIEI
jgi:KUP system potassium uptake protein